jgi:hypothetical protein
MPVEISFVRTNVGNKALRNYRATNSPAAKGQSDPGAR